MWRHERINPVLSKRKLELGAVASHGSMNNRFAASREILSYDPRYHRMLDRYRKCGDPYPCHMKFCEKCFNAPLDPNGWRVDPRRFIADDVVNPVIYRPYVGIGAYRHIDRTLGMIEPFYGLPVDQIAPATIKFCVLRGGEDYVAVKEFYHRWMREIGQGFRDLIHPGVKFVYRFEWSWTTAGQVAWNLPLRAPGLVDTKDMHPDQVVALFHAHCLAHFPGFHHSEAGQFFRMVFDGSWQVHVATPRPDEVITHAMGDAYGLVVEDQGLLTSDRERIPDHPDDALIPWAYGSDQQALAQFDGSIDKRLDALAEKYGEHDGCIVHDLPITGPERASGLVKFASYACKEHLPKAHDRYPRSNTRVLSNPGQCCSSSQTKHSRAGKTEVKVPTLNPKQMVIAIHGDAELKMAFHGRRLVHSFGTRKRPIRKPKPSVARSARTDVTMERAERLRLAGRRLIALYRSWAQSITEVSTDTVIHWVTDPSSTGQRAQTQYLSRSDRTRGLLHATSKEDGRPESQSSLFCWIPTDPAFKLRLGYRVVRPP
jgi:hypothetical protein